MNRLLLAVMLGSFAIGGALVVIFESTLVRVLGTLVMIVFVVCGVFLIADPRFLEEDDD